MNSTANSGTTSSVLKTWKLFWSACFAEARHAESKPGYFPGDTTEESSPGATTFVRPKRTLATIKTPRIHAQSEVRSWLGAWLLFSSSRFSGSSPNVIFRLCLSSSAASLPASARSTESCRVTTWCPFPCSNQSSWEKPSSAILRAARSSRTPTNKNSVFSSGSANAGFATPLVSALPQIPPPWRFRPGFLFGGKSPTRVSLSELVDDDESAESDSGSDSDTASDSEAAHSEEELSSSELVFPPPPKTKSFVRPARRSMRRSFAAWCASFFKSALRTTARSKRSRVARFVMRVTRVTRKPETRGASSPATFSPIPRNRERTNAAHSSRQSFAGDPSSKRTFPPVSSSSINRDSRSSAKERDSSRHVSNACEVASVSTKTDVLALFSFARFAETSLGWYFLGFWDDSASSSRLSPWDDFASSSVSPVRASPRQPSTCLIARSRATRALSSSPSTAFLPATPCFTEKSASLRAFFKRVS
mmetsp:Transcript_9819/g.32437  ORF Transcript_9819/g.32437 Transcript_9819/m.32437 type:complete len:477 (+) Transcript_9819:3545-4975(+)